MSQGLTPHHWVSQLDLEFSPAEDKSATASHTE